MMDCGKTWSIRCVGVSITWTPCHYGGARAWFICPAPGCGRRVAILYRGSLCRRCYQLAYNSQRRTPIDRATTKAQKIRMRLGGSANLAGPFPRKPKRMHWSTYERLRREEAEASARSWPAWLLKGIPSAPLESRDSLNSLMKRLMSVR